MVRRVILNERLDSAAADGLRNDLAEATGGDVALDASAVAVLGGLCLELLMCARQVWSDAGRRFTVENASQAFAQDLALLGLTLDQLNGGKAA